MTKHFQRCPANSKRFRSFILSFGAAAIWLLATLAPDAARAQTDNTTQAVDTAVQIFVNVANTAGGIGIPPEATPVLQGLVNCAVAGTAGGDCAKNILVSTALGALGSQSPEVASIVGPAVTCLVGGGSASGCLSTAAISQLPPEAQPLASCIVGGGNVADCAVKSTEGLIVQQISQAAGPEVSKDVTAIMSCATTPTAAANCVKQGVLQNLPDSVKPFATCMTSPGANVQSCTASLAAGAVGQQNPQAAALVACMGNTDGNAMQACAVKAGLSAASAAAGQAVQTAANALAQVNVDLTTPQVPPKFPVGPAVLQNMVELAQGIQTGDWTKIVEGVGQQFFEMASQVILSVFLTPEVAGFLAPVVNAMITNDATAAENALNEASKGNIVGLAQTAFQWYATTLFQPECALFSGKAMDAVCNFLGGAVNDLSNFGGGVLKDILGAGKSILGFVGLWKPIDTIVTDAFDDVKDVADDIFDGRTHTCGTDSASLTNYYNANVAICARNAADNQSTGQNSTQVVVNNCNATFQHCAAIAPACAAMGSALQNLGSGLAQNIGSAAAMYATGVPAFVQTAVKKGYDMCDPGFWADHMAELIAPCQSTLDAMAPANPSCALASYPDTDGQPPNPGGKQSASHYACRQAVYGMTQSLASLVGPGSQACQNQITAVEVTNILDRCHEVPVRGGIPGLVMKQCDPPFIPSGWLRPRPTVGIGFEQPPWLRPAGPGAIIPFPPKGFGIPVVFTPNPFSPPKKGPPQININPIGTRLPPRLVPATPPPQANNGGSGGPSFVNGCSGNSPAAGCSNGTKSSPMDQLGDAQINGGLTGVAGTGSGGGFGPGRPNAPKGLPLGGKPPGGIIIGGGGKPTGGGTGGTNGNTGNGAGKPAGPGTGGGGPVMGNGNGGGNGGINKVNGGTGNAPTAPAWAPTKNGTATNIFIKPPIKPPPKPAGPPADPNAIDFGGCAVCTNPQGPVVK